METFERITTLIQTSGSQAKKRVKKVTAEEIRVTNLKEKFGHYIKGWSRLSGLITQGKPIEMTDNFRFQIEDENYSYAIPTKMINGVGHSPFKKRINNVHAHNFYNKLKTKRKDMFGSGRFGLFNSHINSCRGSRSADNKWFWTDGSVIVIQTVNIEVKYKGREEEVVRTTIHHVAKT
jgi:hypothetical protein